MGHLALAEGCALTFDVSHAHQIPTTCTLTRRAFATLDTLDPRQDSVHIAAQTNTSPTVHVYSFGTFGQYDSADPTCLNCPSQHLLDAGSTYCYCDTSRELMGALSRVCSRQLCTIQSRRVHRVSQRHTFSS
jgi:hypothetical protein